LLARAYRLRIDSRSAYQAKPRHFHRRWTYSLEHCRHLDSTPEG
jgi:hypothetical protein